MRDIFTSNLLLMFPEAPYWVRRHIDQAESTLVSHRQGRRTNVFVDNLVDNTAIEYETNLQNHAIFLHGLGQVQEYCASLVNTGIETSMIYGVLSDTLEWHVYSVSVTPMAYSLPIRPDQVTLTEIDNLNLRSSQPREGEKLLRFLTSYLGRVGSRYLSAENIANDLGFNSPFYENKVAILHDVVERAFIERPQYAEMIQELWGNFVAYLNPTDSTFSIDIYVAELYIMTLAKMICANALVGKALTSNEEEIKSILHGEYFSNLQLDNMVEHDYFGWLMELPYIQEISGIGSLIQRDLTAYKFSHLPEDKDIFGPLMAQLADKTRRILLGQEWTPTWLAERMARELVAMLPAGEAPRFVDMCCGSGAMISKVLTVLKERLSPEQLADKDAAISFLSQGITGFDIDPVAVLLSKITWILSIKEVFLGITRPISIPVYHADSLFLITPIERRVKHKDNEPHALNIDGETINLPRTLLQPQFQELFDELIEQAYQLGKEASTRALKEKQLQPRLNLTAIKAAILQKLSSNTIDEEGKTTISDFVTTLADRIAILDFYGRNGIWAFILRNTYRPSLVIGNFNGIISNPPWLAMSKIAENPYKEDITQIAERYGIKPTGSSFPHLDLSTVFTTHAIDRYIGINGIFACILPSTILNGHHHNPFRISTGPVSIGNYLLSGIWEIDKEVFKNRAVVIFGRKGESLERHTTIPGGVIGPEHFEAITWHWASMGNRAIWSREVISENVSGLYNPANFKQGADILPRRLFSVDIVSQTGNRSEVQSVGDRSSLFFAVKDAKAPFNTFSLTGRCLVANELIFKTVLSKHLAPFNLSLPQLVNTIAPIRRDSSGMWQLISDAELILLDRGSKLVFDQINTELAAHKADGGRTRLWDDYLNYRNKLTHQEFPKSGFLVLTGAGGQTMCSTYLDIGRIDINRLLIDQTLYWVVVDTEDEAIYLSGLFNSEAINSVIVDFVPRGAFGGRHQHTLPFGVTPPFDTNEVSHREVVEKTRSLLAEFSVRREEINRWANRSRTDKQLVLDVFSANNHIGWRRKTIRKFIKTKLVTYSEYENACKALYGL